MKQLTVKYGLTTRALFNLFGPVIPFVHIFFLFDDMTEAKNEIWVTDFPIVPFNVV